MTEKKDNSDRRKDATGLIYQTIKKLGLLTKRVETIEHAQKELERLNTEREKNKMMKDYDLDRKLT